MDYKIFELKNGIRAVYKYRNSPVSCFSITFNAGSADEHKEEYGIAHFIEHCFFKGTKKRNTYQIISRIDEVGGELNAFTSKEDTCIYSVFLNQHSERAIELIGDISFNSTFPKTEIAKEKVIVLDEINSYKDNPAESIFDDFDEYLLHGHPLAHPVLGYTDTVKNFNSQSIHKFIDRVFRNENTVLCYIGKEKFDVVKLWIEKYFSESTFKKEKNPTAAPAPQKKQFEISKNESNFQTHCVMGTIAYNHHHPNKTALFLLNNILGGPAMNSRLNMVIREKNALSYQIESHFTPYSSTGVFCIYFGTDPANLNKCLDLIDKEFKRIKTHKISTLEFEMYQNQLKGQIAIAQQGMVNEMLSIGKSLLVFDKIDTLREINRKIDKITPSKLIEVANELLDNNSISRLVYCP